VSDETGPPQVAWIAIDENAVVVAADGSEIGKVKEVAGDKEHDIFDGLVVKHSRFGSDQYVASERVRGIWPDRVETDLTSQEAESLPDYSKPRETTWHADTGQSRLSRAFRDLFGRRR
jgi:hypothetical protein